MRYKVRWWHASLVSPRPRNPPGQSLRERKPVSSGGPYFVSNSTVHYNMLGLDILPAYEGSYFHNREVGATAHGARDKAVRKEFSIKALFRTPILHGRSALRNRQNAMNFTPAVLPWL